MLFKPSTKFIILYLIGPFDIFNVVLKLTKLIDKNLILYKIIYPHDL